jgi:hypothetical protein
MVFLGVFLMFSAFVSQNNLPLSEEEKEGLLLMREEEKLAFEVYSVMNKTWNHHVFSNIKESEAYHGDLVKGLINKYNLKDPYIAEEGKYGNQTLQNLYNSLVNKGKNSLTDAFEVGATIEDLDIADLEKLISNTQNAELKEVYETLNLGSRNHLRAFVKQLNRNDKPYLPQYISQNRFETIVNGQHEQCSDNKDGIGRKENKKCCSSDQKGKSCSGNGGKKACAGEKSSKKACAGQNEGMSCRNRGEMNDNNGFEKKSCCK